MSGNVSTTAETVRAAIRVIGTAPGIRTVSSAFLMIGPEAAMTFADCGVVPEPTATQLADIAIASAETHRTLTGEKPRVAMLSFSTKGSASHAAVDRVVDATRIVRERSPRLVVDGELQLDAAIVHANRADARGNAQLLGPDPYFDDLFLGAAKRRFVSCERLVATSDLLAGGPPQTLAIGRHLVDGVVETPGGAHFTECPPDYGRDEKFQKEYATAARDPEAWRAFEARYLSLADEREYQRAVGRA